MTIRHAFRVLLLCSTLGFGSLIGVPMHAEQIEELLACVHQPKIAHTLPDEADSDDEDEDAH